MSTRILTGDCRSVLKTLPDESVHCVVTSPPYFGLRDYGTAQWEGGEAGCEHVDHQFEGSRVSNSPKQKTQPGSYQLQYKDECGHCGARRIDSQIGLEPTPAAYVAELVAVFREVRRVLRSDGTCWLNLGDSYAGNSANRNGLSNSAIGSGPEGACKQRDIAGQSVSKVPPGLKPKDLIGIPWSVAFALRADGWWLRQDIIWSKLNPMPESVTDRCTKAHEYIFLLTKSATYSYDAEAIAEQATETSGWAKQRARGENTWEYNNSPERIAQTGQRIEASTFGTPGTRNKRSVWHIATQSFSEAHFATFPPALIEPCILAGCPAKCCAKCGASWVRETNRDADARQVDESEIDRFGDGSAGVHRKIGSVYQKWLDENPKRTVGFSPSCACNAATVAGTCLDPFGGAGTTGLVADRLQRNAILIELNPEYAAMAERRIHNDAPLFAEAAE